MDLVLLSPCNVYCGHCVLYKKGKCFGCAKESERVQAEGKSFCGIYTCAKARNLITCSDCENYPCEKYDKEGIFSATFIKWVRERLKGH